MSNLKESLIKSHQKRWLQDRDSESLSWLYYEFLSKDDGVRDYEQIMKIFGEPTHNDLERHLSEWASPEGETIFMIHWSKSEPRTALAWTMQKEKGKEKGVRYLFDY
jgi:hypothetical protein